MTYLLVEHSARCASSAASSYAEGACKLKRPAKKKPTRREWTPTELRALKKHSKDRTPVVKISKEMKRSVGALRQKALVLGFGLGHQR